MTRMCRGCGVLTDLDPATGLCHGCSYDDEAIGPHERRDRSYDDDSGEAEHHDWPHTDDLP